MKTEQRYVQEFSQGAPVVRVMHRNFERAAEFYGKYFNCCIITDAAVLHESDGRRIVLVRDDIGGDPTVLKAIPRRSPVTEFVVEDFDERMQELIEAGCLFPPCVSLDDSPLQYVQFTDPFGHLWSLNRFDVSRHSDMKPK